MKFRRSSSLTAVAVVIFGGIEFMQAVASHADGSCTVQAGTFDLNVIAQEVQRNVASYPNCALPGATITIVMPNVTPNGQETSGNSYGSIARNDLKYEEQLAQDIANILKTQNNTSRQAIANIK